MDGRAGLSRRALDRRDPDRQFTADDLVAFAQAFRLPVTYFFLPTRPTATWPKVDPKATAAQLSRTAAVMLDIIFGDANDGAPRLTNRLHEVMEHLDRALMTRAQRQIHDLAKRRLLAVVEKAIGSLATWQYTLRPWPTTSPGWPQRPPRTCPTPSPTSLRGMWLRS